MRDAAIRDGWRRLHQDGNYSLKLTSVGLKNVIGFHDKFSIELNSGLTAICGKNGVGKSSLLKFIYESLSNDVKHPKIKNDSELSLSVVKNNIPVTKPILDSNELYYIDPSFECSRIIYFIANTVNFEEFLEGVESNGFLNKPKTISSVSSCIGKPYKKIEIYEIENALAEEYTFPYFRIELCDGTKYDSLSMGMGEHLCMFLLWYIDWIESNSILLLEELENYLAAYSQKKILDYLVYRLSEKRVWTILTTHSEHILSMVGLSNTRILYRNGTYSLSVKPESSNKYLKALGLMSNKQGVYFVEDYFASIKLKAIVNYFSPELLDIRDIVGLRCDSNMEKLIKHFEPSNKPFFDLMAVFDADQSSKISKLTGKAVGAICLPSKSSRSPEEELWNTLNEYSTEISRLLNVNVERMSEAIEMYELEDHHERYHRIAASINVTLEQLTGSILKQWLEEEQNLNLAKKFMIALTLRGELVDLDTIQQVCNRFSADELVDELSNSFRKLDAGELRLTFDGSKLELVV
ncbi:MULTISPECIES: ATP-dependent nuclease [Vibrio]|uniref:ATP-dependent nuclease n=1 Tax=Vibrio TaxID=662 RepID=UPI001EFD8F89|nr:MULTISPECIES: AAA family ATPase [Vibrio]MCG9744278.1 AAA family ATPase [Vibrio alginolyticus]MCS0398578.1 AAA family ATPase [Vibrio diabolicus]MDW1636065.1 AAA family ATPase [Vibrio sp. Vb2907]MDW1706838.1 AAA family ATPase [Vibrio sp. Vb2917]MDW1721402.1 AAA family ATPase [Vibrio sp. Vb2979]